MEARKVTEKEAKELMSFCKKKGIVYLDLRVELVDHLAHSLEEYWQENPTASFSQALLAVYKKFGIFGFTDVAEEHEKTMNKRYFKELMISLKKLLAWPNVLLFVMLAAIIYTSTSQFIVARQICHWVFVAIIISGFFGSLYIKLTNRKILNKETTIIEKGPIQYLFWFYWLFFSHPINTLMLPENLLGEWVPLKTTLLILGVLIFTMANITILLKARYGLQDLKVHLA